ncbi:MAG: heat-inducible transcriptional repressor HrcA [Burkholderiales bacterium]|nr:heat-inducible transcriptional repressor HrcA [Burkholderiales bacterium]
MLNERAQVLLKTLVERYIEEGQPLGSRALSHYSGLDLSAASIRNVMSDLEALGFIASPHTSAGRIPTAKGYRFFVDTLLVVKPLEQQEIEQLGGNLLPNNPSRLISSASQLLSELTQFAGVVMTPKRDAFLRHIEFLKLSDKRLLLIFVTSNGDVQNRIMFSEKEYSSSELTEASNFLSQNFAGLTLNEIHRRVKEEVHDLQRNVSELMSAAVNASSGEGDGEDCIISGKHNLLHVHDLSSNLSSLRSLFDLFEKKTALLQLLDASRNAQGVQIFIGRESGLGQLDECSVVTAPYHSEGKIVGTLAVVGPKRMAYERIIPIVDVTAKLLSGALSQN